MAPPSAYFYNALFLEKIHNYTSIETWFENNRFKDAP